MSFLEMLDVVNERLMERGEEPIAFDHDCREGICGSCGLMINGVAHGPNRGTATCQLHMRSFHDGDEITHRAVARAGLPGGEGPRRGPRARSTGSSRPAASSRAPTGGAPDANAILIPKPDVDTAMDAAQCIGCGACVAACPNGVGLALHRGEDHPPRPAAAGPAGALRPCAAAWCAQMDLEGFGHCTLYGECQEACPKEISIDTITRMNRDYLRASLTAGRAAVAESD